MFIVAKHRISDPAQFWGLAQTAQLPAGVTLHTSFPNAGGTEAVCLWEADSVDTVRQLIDGLAGSISQNEFFAVDVENAVGLPTST